jgi:hypothetical protein
MIRMGKHAVGATSYALLCVEDHNNIEMHVDSCDDLTLNDKSRMHAGLP